MIKLLEKLQHFLFQLGQSILTCIKIVILSKFGSQKTPKPKDSHCYILANGPSLNESIQNHFSHFKGKELLCVNFFPNTPFYTQLQTQYLVLQAPEFWLENVQQSYKDNRKVLFENIIQKTNWPLTIFLPFEAKKHTIISDLPKQNKHITLSFYNPTPVEGLQGINHFFFSQKLGMPRPHNVLIPSIMLALQMNFKEIFLLGADHSWLPEIWVTDDNIVLLHQKHFYDKKISKPDTMKKLGKKDRNLHEILEKFMLSFKAYFEIKAFADKQSVQIWNATPNSFIDAFDRKKLEELNG